jgi:hypothetical protein
MGSKGAICMPTSLVRLTSLFCLASAVTFAASWTGALVDSDCYGRVQANTSHDAGHTGTNPKKVIKTCSAKETTKSFAIVEQNGAMFNLDSTGQEGAIMQVLKTSKTPHVVQVTGDLNQNTIKVAGISKAK